MKRVLMIVVAALSLLVGLKGSFRPTLLERLWPLALLALAAFVSLKARS